MSKKRTHHSSEFKAKVALTAIRGDETIPQPASDVDLVLLRKMDEQYLKTPQYGSRSYAT